MDPYRPARSTPRRATRRYDANDYRAIAADGPVALHRPDRQRGLRAGLGVQDADRVGRAADRARSASTTKINDSGTLKLDGGKTKVDDADRKAMGWMTFEDVVAYSRNVGVAQVAFGLGKTTAAASAVLYDTWRRLGIGQPTGIDLAGEVGGHRPRPGDRRPGARSTSPTARSARASPSRRSSWRRPTPRWSTAGRWSSRTSSPAIGDEDASRRRPRAEGSSSADPVDAR